MRLLPVGEMATTTGTYAAAHPHHYAWWFPGSPVRVHLDLHLVEGLQKRLRDIGHDTAEHGLLFGRVVDGATEIVEFRPAFDRNVPEMIVELSPDSARRLVGYYRSGDALVLNTEDLSLFKTFFGKPYQVFLVIQPNGFAPPNATFFFSQGNQKVSEFPFLEFPLDASLLATEERDRISRYRQANHQPAAEPLPPGPVQSRQPGRLFPRIALAIPAAAVLLLPALWFTSPPFRQRFTRLWSASQNTIRPPQSPPVAASPTSPQPGIGLQVKWQAGDLNLTWNHESPAILAATSGSISIADGSVKSSIALDAQQLRGESILYSPVSDQVLFQITLATPTGNATQAIQVIRAKQTPTYSVVTPTQPPPPDEHVPVTQPSRPFTLPPAAGSAASAPQPLRAPVFTPALSTGPEPANSAISASVAPPRPVPAAPVSPPAPVVVPEAYDPPVPLRKVAPVFPEELRPLITKPVAVSIRVSIDRNGRVVKAEALPRQSVHQLFIMSALHAAELWKFQPARRGGETVASDSVLRFAFAP